MKQKIVKKYIRQIRRIYQGRYQDKKQFLDELQDALLCFYEEHPDSTYTDLVQKFGRPSEMKGFLSFHSAEKLHKRNMFLYWTINIAVIITVSILVFFTIRHVMNRYDYVQGYYIETFDDDANSNINPLTGETDPPPKKKTNFN
ncbi:MAG: hypothetical protein K2J67_00320 [Lachnospiraceae bacterium]|nr:hypothetical protein [Lachnospiraceae bacterium]